MYHGGIMPNRGIERLIQLASVNPNLAVIILGNGEESFILTLKQQAQKLSVADRIYFHKAVPQTELWKYVGAADVGMILTAASCKNQLYSLPNKFFENIQSETPVICPAYPAMEQIINRYKNGLSCDPTNILEINQCVEQLRTDSKLYGECKENVKKAKEVFYWEKEKNRLKGAYRKILS